MSSNESLYFKIHHWINHRQHVRLKLVQVICALYIVIKTFSVPPIGIRNPETNTIIDVNSAQNTENGLIYVNGDYRPVVAANTWQMICLAFSRTSAFSMYPVLIFVFFSKCKATLNAIHMTPITLKYEGLTTESHEIHAYAGSFIVHAVIVHVLFHILRWANQGNMILLVKSRAGISGLIAAAVLPLIACLMLYDYLKRKIPYEIRRKLHNLFYLFAIALCFHVPTSAIPGGGFIGPVMGTTLIYYFLDYAYVALFMTEKIQTPVFQVLKSGFQVTMTVSSRFKQRLDQGGFVYVCLPWINNEWHAFSLFEFPHDDNKRQIFIQNLGDWTNKVHEALQRDTCRPIWVQGPFTSSFHHAENYDNQILVATGIGITPILSAVLAYNKSRRVNIVWIVREEDMLTFFLEYLNINKDGWVLVFYTGKTTLHPVLLEYWSESNIKIITKRPSLGDLIPNIIFGIESGKLYSEPTNNKLLDSQAIAIDKVASKLSAQEFAHLSEKEIRKQVYDELNSFGYQFTGIIKSLSSVPNESIKSINIENKPNALSNIEEDSYNNKDSSVEPLKSTFLKSALTDSNKIDSSSDDTCKNSFVQELNVLRSQIIQRKSSKMVSMKNDQDVYEPWKQDDRSSDYVHHLDEKILETWGLFFCGGNKYVLKDLNDASKRYGIDLHTESFFW